MFAVASDDHLRWVRHRMRNIDNLRVLVLDVGEVIDWTPGMEVWKKWKDQLVQSKWTNTHVSDFLRLCWLWKYGGLYLDLDTLVLGDLYHLHNNYLGFQYFSTKDGVNTAVIKMTRHHQLLLSWLEEARDRYDPEVRAVLGPLMATSLVADYCGEELEAEGGREPGRLDDLAAPTQVQCNTDLNMVGPEVLYPVPWPDWKKIFESGTHDAARLSLLCLLYTSPSPRDS